MELYWIVIAFIAGGVALHLNLPTLVGYILAGVALAAFNVESTEFIKESGDVGIMILLFTVGLHIRLKNVFRPEVYGAGGTHQIISLAIYGGIALLFGLSLPAAIFVGIGLGFSSTVLSAKALEAKNELDAFHGRVAMGVLIFQDIVATVLLAFTGTETPEPYAIGLLLLFFMRPVMYRLLDFGQREELILLFGLLMAFGIGELFYLSGLSAKLGALLAGILLADHRSSHMLYDKLWALKEVFLVGFFLDIGLTGFPDLGGFLTASIFVALLPVKAAMFFFLFMFFKLRARTAFLAGLSLTAYSEFALIVVAASVDGGFVESSWLTILAIVVATSFIINSAINSVANDLWVRYEPILTRYEPDLEHPDQHPRRLGSTKYIVVGMGRVGSSAYDYLVEQGERPLGFDADPATIQRNLDAGRRVQFADSQDPELWEAIKLEKLSGIILAIPNVEAKLNASELLRENGYKGKITALLRDGIDPEQLTEAGINSVLLPLSQAGRELAEQSLVTQPAT